jgi:O-antigen ligase/polysaccharide polymerase Wzy-like membrane protein
MGAPRAGSLALPALVFLLPFEPRRPVLPLLGFQLTLLEAAAGAMGLVLLWSARGRLPALLRRPPLPLAFLGLYAAAHVLSAAFAPAHRDLAAKFALRMLVMAALAVAVAAAPPEAGRRALVALVASAVAVAALAVAEGAGWQAFDPLLSHFREMPFNIGGSRRATATTEYPNLAAAFVMAGMLAACGLATAWRRPLLALLPLTALFSAALLWTYSRGALVATALGLAALAAAGGLRRRVAAPALAGLAVLLAASAAFAWSGEVYRLRLEAEGAASWYGAAYEPAEKALTLRPGEARTTGVRVTNTGRMTWRADRLFHLSYHWYDAAGRKVEDGRRTRLPRDIGPGEAVALEAEVQAPAAPGSYRLGWDMVQERVSWFSDRDVTPAMVPARVEQAAPAAAAVALPRPPAPASSAVDWQPGRAELWRLALVLWRRQPLTGVGSDNYRWLYGEAAGRSSWDTRVFANNALLEAAATTGLLGLFALAGTLVATLASAWNALGRSSVPVGAAAALFALAVGLAAHGVVDYLLAFTGHYVLFAFVVGSVAALSRWEVPA